MRGRNMAENTGPPGRLDVSTGLPLEGKLDVDANCGGSGVRMGEWWQQMTQGGHQKSHEIWVLLPSWIFSFGRHAPLTCCSAAQQTMNGTQNEKSFSPAIKKIPVVACPVASGSRASTWSCSWH
ncbi:hypothetical protein MAPG_00519 [Magnaporthiopsis poae ATCC 64411]|uniref:Uncharacterized protein n=1 Tax=Magnaporthiopsis poae (strain ATCC 64411 / 73-15) TaxID=644358 RepID=A0A0C4DL79_MAGP6|nr:hypothetical protein MAPG_00519 [Magnaporthiopsis poae ATCC 64411]